MTKDEYIKWKAERGDPGTWDHSICVVADKLIKDTTLVTANKWIDEKIPLEARELLKLLISARFGSVEIDEFLVAINAYPEWM